MTARSGPAAVGAYVRITRGPEDGQCGFVLYAGDDELTVGLAGGTRILVGQEDAEPASPGDRAGRAERKLSSTERGAAHNMMDDAAALSRLLGIATAARFALAVIDQGVRDDDARRVLSWQAAHELVDALARPAGDGHRHPPDR